MHSNIYEIRPGFSAVLAPAALLTVQVDQLDRLKEIAELLTAQALLVDRLTDVISDEIRRSDEIGAALAQRLEALALGGMRR